MFEEARYTVDSLADEFYDLCLTASERWFAVTKFGHRQGISFNGKTVSLPEPLRVPSIASIDEETALVVDGRASDEYKNAWIVADSGAVKGHFFAGDAIQDVLVTENFIVTTYFDESALSSRGIEGNGVGVFDLQGNFQFGYRELFSTDAVDVADCYCACCVARDRILFFPYTKFPLVSFDLKTRTQEIWPTPAEVAGSKAITSVGPVVYFHGPYHDKSGMYRWTVGEERAEKIDQIDFHLRGLPNGRFLAVDEMGYRVISMT
jgi:hypothetical protein